MTLPLSFSLYSPISLTHISRGQGRLCPCHKMSLPSQTHKITPRRRDQPGLVSVCHSSVTLAVRTHLSARHVDRLNTCTSHIQQHACLLENRKCFAACKHCIVLRSERIKVPGSPSGCLPAINSIYVILKAKGTNCLLCVSQSFELCVDENVCFVFVRKLQKCCMCFLD